MKAKSYGFTIAELLVVVGILSILAAGLLATLDPITQLQRGWDTRRKSDLAQIQKALEVYYNDFGQYPPSSSANKIVGLNGSAIEWGTSWSPYMTQLPKDHTPLRRYVYHSTGQAYYLYANLVRGAKDPQVCPLQETLQSNKCPNVPTGETCGDVCNYGVTSANVLP